MNFYFTVLPIVIEIKYHIFYIYSILLQKLF